MKVTGATLSWYQAPHNRPIRNGRFVYAVTNKLVCRLRTDEGAEGIGWVNGGNLVMPVLEEMAYRVLDEDPRNHRRVFTKLDDVKSFGRGGLAGRALGAIDIACWDLVGRFTGESIHRLLGGLHESLPAYVAGGYYVDGKHLGELSEEALDQLEKGARAFKMKIGGLSIAEDVQRVRAVVEAVRGRMSVLVDANGSYDRIEARAMGRELADLGVFWFEEPLDADDVDGAVWLRDQISVPIAIGENTGSVTEFRRLLAAADYLNPDAQIVGGVTSWLRCAEAALASGVMIAPHGDQEIHIHLAAAFPNAAIVEYYRHTNPLRESMFEQSLHLDGEGRVSPPDRPGLGFDLNEERLRPFLQRRVEVP